MQDPHEAGRRLIEDAVLRGPGHVDARLREAVAARRDVPDDLRALVDKVALHAYKVTDEDFAALKGRYTDDELFEIVVSAALGTAQERLRAGLRALQQA
jgi:hypothetical protein